MRFYNTLTRKKEVFRPQKNKRVSLYTCGPTVYWYAHIGNLRTYIFEDFLKRSLEYENYKVKHVMNITDVGHLTSDQDTGEDKMEKGAKREKKTVWEIAEFYTKAFKEDIEKLNIKRPDKWTRVTNYIKEQIDLIKILEKKGFTYTIEDGVYFDTSKLPDYGKIAQRKKMKEARTRLEKVEGKKLPEDFALWKLTQPGVKRQMEWDSPWGRGFPGWHTECVVMAAKNLGLPLDIHCGGVDHITVHHPNEIAQAKAGYGKRLANFWLHGEFLVLKKGRMGKSEGNIITLKDLERKGFDPLAYRYLCLNTHYRKKLTFSWDILQSAQNSYDNLREKVSELRKTPKKTSEKYQKKFQRTISDDLNMPQALALAWDLIKDKKVSEEEKYNTLIEIDKVFGLNLKKVKPVAVPEEIEEKAEQREQLRKRGKWEKADKIRKEIKKKGFEIEDTKEGPKIRRAG